MLILPSWAPGWKYRICIYICINKCVFNYVNSTNQYVIKLFTLISLSMSDLHLLQEIQP